MNYSINQHGKPLDKSKYTIDEANKTFSSKENDLVLDFSDLDGWSFKTGYSCTFKTGSYCTFKTGSYCIFNTESFCIFNTHSNCTFHTIYECIFKTEKNCVIVRRDVYEIIEIPLNIKIKLNGYEIKGYKIIEDTKEEMITIDGKEVSKLTVKEALKQFVNNL